MKLILGAMASVIFLVMGFLYPHDWISDWLPLDLFRVPY